MVTDPYRPPVRSAASIAALTVSIVALYFAAITGIILAMAFGLIAIGLATWGLVLANRHGRGGRGLATWALILGVLAFIGGAGPLIAAVTR